jgi:hypothetical protein
VDWAGWAVFGLVATTGLTTAMILAQLGRWTRLDLPLLLGSATTEDPDRARVAGFVLHLAIGQAFAWFYAPGFARLGQSAWCSARSWASPTPRSPSGAARPAAPGHTPAHGDRARRPRLDRTKIESALECIDLGKYGTCRAHHRCSQRHGLRAVGPCWPFLGHR